MGIGAARAAPWHLCASPAAHPVPRHGKSPLTAPAGTGLACLPAASRVQLARAEVQGQLSA